jgi:hypothetical protein
MPVVNLPDGRKVNFPDTMSEQEITSALQSIDSTQPPAPVQAAGAAEGTFTGTLKGLRDPIDAGAQMLVNWLPQRVVEGANRFFGDKLAPTAPMLNRQIAEAEAQYQRGRKASGDTGVDWDRMFGNMVSTAPLTAALPAAGASFASAAGAGALSGAASGALQPVTDGGEDFTASKLKQTGVGAATGGGAGVAMKAVSRAINPIVDEATKYLLDRGVQPTTGQLLGKNAAKFEERVANTVPFVGDKIQAARGRAVDQLNVAAYNDALKPIGKVFTGQPGREGYAAVEEMAGQAFDDLLPKMQFKADADFVNGMNKLLGMAQGLPKAEADQFAKVVQQKLLTRVGPKGTMDGQTLQGVMSELRQLSSGYRGDASFDKRQLGDAIGEVAGLIDDTLERANPDYASAYRAARETWANVVRLRKAASMATGEPGVFSPAQLQGAVRQMDKSVGKGATARGDALMGKLADAGRTVLGNTVPNSGTAERLANFALLGSLGAGATISPTAAAGGALALAPYTKSGQALMAALLAKRPTNVTAPLAAIVDKSITPAQAALASALLSNPGSPFAP